MCKNDPKKIKEINDKWKKKFEELNNKFHNNSIIKSTNDMRNDNNNEIIRMFRILLIIII